MLYLYTDFHMHSNFSFDSKTTMDEMCIAAIDRGIGSIAFTEHYDIVPVGIEVTGDDDRIYYSERSDAARDAVFAAREKYKGKLNIVYAIELGESHHDIDAAKAFIDSHDFDFVLGSVHQAESTGYADYYFVDYSKQDIDKLLTAYYNENISIVKTGILDSLAHLDYPARVMEGFIPSPASMIKFRDTAAEVLKAIVARGVALEINTNGKSRWFDRLSPEPWVLSLYKDLGGSLVTVGSDSHSDKLVGFHSKDAFELAEAHGLKVVTNYINRNPII